MHKNVTYNRRTQFKLCVHYEGDLFSKCNRFYADRWFTCCYRGMTAKGQKKKKKPERPSYMYMWLASPLVHQLLWHKNSKFPYTAFQWSFFFHIEWIALMFEHWTERFFFLIHFPFGGIQSILFVFCEHFCKSDSLGLVVKMHLVMVTEKGFKILHTPDSLTYFLSYRFFFWSHLSCIFWLTWHQQYFYSFKPVIIGTLKPRTFTRLL